MRNPLKRLARPDRPMVLFRRTADRPSLKDRAAAIRARLAAIAKRRDGETDPQRRVMVAGSIMAAIPLPTIAKAAGSKPHPDAALIELHAAFVRATEAKKSARSLFYAACDAQHGVLAQRPPALLPLRREYLSVEAFPGRSPWKGIRFRWVPPGEGDDGYHWSTVAWTSDGLRKAISQAVPALGRGGQTPHLVRRWKALMPVADAFDARVAAVEAATDYHRLCARHEAAERACGKAREAITRSVATTPEGLAALVAVTAEWVWKDMGGPWPNLLRSAANVSGVPLAALEHEYASTRDLRA